MHRNCYTDKTALVTLRPPLQDFSCGHVIFLSSDAMRKRGLRCRMVSVCPSVTLVYCIHTAEGIVKLISRPGSPMILVFDPQVPMPNSKGTPSGGAKYTGLDNFAIFDRNRCLSPKR